MTALTAPNLLHGKSPLHELLSSADAVILGKSRQIRLAVTCLLAGGHLLIEDLPGVGKTTLAHALARLFGLTFSRIQFTSDMLPGDITGVSIFDRERAAFKFMPGPLFTQLLLADEINRANPKTQSALLEAMEEHQVTIDGTTRPLPHPFFVIATQNPIDQYGTFPLPESQMDRFLMRIELGYPTREAELALLGEGSKRQAADQLTPLMSVEALASIQENIEKTYASPALLSYLLSLVEATRHDETFLHGLSPRAGLGLLKAAKAWAWLNGHQMVLPDDVQAVFSGVARHRLRARKHSGMASQDEIRQLLERVAIP